MTQPPRHRISCRHRRGWRRRRPQPRRRGSRVPARSPRGSRRRFGAGWRRHASASAARAGVAAVLAAAAALFVLAAPAHAWRRPVPGPVARGFAYSPAEPFAAGRHRGVDLAARPGEAVRAPCSGVVAYAGRGVVTLRCGPWRVTHLPLATLTVRAGARVREGARLGTLAASREHLGLHLGVRRAGDRFAYVDPLPFLRPEMPRVGPPAAPRGRAPHAPGAAPRRPEPRRRCPEPRRRARAAPTAPGAAPAVPGPRRTRLPIRASSRRPARSSRRPRAPGFESATGSVAGVARARAGSRRRGRWRREPARPPAPCAAGVGTFADVSRRSRAADAPAPRATRHATRIGAPGKHCRRASRRQPPNLRRRA